MEKYFLEEVEKTVESINSLAGEDCMVFTILADVHVHPELPEGYVAVDRELYTLSEDLWDTVIYNIKENKINVVRFGVGEDAEYTLD